MCVCKTRFKNTQSSKSTFLSDFVAVFQKGGGRKKGANYFSSWFSIKFKNSYKISFGLSFLFSASHCDFLNFSSKENTSKMLAPTPRSISRSSKTSFCDVNTLHS